MCDMSVADLSDYVAKLKLGKTDLNIAETILKEIKARLPKMKIKFLIANFK